MKNVKYVKPKIYEIFPNKLIEEDSAEKSVDPLGFSSFEEYLSDKILPGLNKRVNRAKYIYLFAFIRDSINNGIILHDSDNEDEWICFCENWFTYGIKTKNANEFKTRRNIIGKDSNKILSKRLFSPTLLRLDQRNQGPYASYNTVVNNLIEKYDENAGIRMLLNRSPLKRAKQKVEKSFLDRKINDKLFSYPIFTFKLNAAEKQCLRNILYVNAKRKMVFKALSDLIKRNSEDEGIDTFSIKNDMSNIADNELRRRIRVAETYSNIAGLANKILFLLCNSIKNNEEQTGDWLRLKADEQLPRDNEITLLLKEIEKDKRHRRILKFIKEFDELMRNNRQKSLKELLVGRHNDVKAGNALIDKKGRLTKYAREKMGHNDLNVESYTKPSFRLSNCLELARDLK